MCILLLTLIVMDNIVIQKTDQGSFYCRSMSQQSIALSALLEKCYPCKQSATPAIICPSGMASISICLNALLIDNKNEMVNIIRGNELYCDTPRLVRQLHKIYNFNDYTINVDNVDEIKNIFDAVVNKQINILFLESASNPSGDIFDFAMIPTLRKKSKKLFVIVDNTWLTHVIFNPFEFDVDIVVTSLTKYYSGGNCIAGAVICKKKYYGRIYDYLRFNGLHTSPLHCQTVIDNLPKMEEIIIKSSAMTKLVVESMSHDSRFTIRHSSLTNDPSYSKALQFYKKVNGETLYPSIISFTVPLELNDAIKWMKSKNISYETSYGSSNTRFDNWPEQHGDKTLCRLAIGFSDNVERICHELSLD
ncbi:hypothetical protein QJ856_gp0659 [Tupanvirus deep ocean]|uniref:Uncharacterized protein n=2 Tax=Tupanvirus TaxID=2094720 RepID=A0AC62A8I3_9VIRU|nr:hypothetical protein QJ856_gp0659 [Tupanvirus deep ocean]QKU34091.1 hypothetical protein [Tupanvirus deep ocean]